MNRPFLRVYAVLAVVIVIATVSLQWLARRHFDRQLDERVAELVAGPLERLRADLESAPAGRLAPERLERMVSERIGMPARVVPAPPPHLRARLATGEVVVDEHHGRRVVWAQLRDDAWLTLGPSAIGPRRGSRSRLVGPLVVLLLAGGAGLAVLRPMERRLERLGDAARAFGDGDLSRRARDEGDDAVGRLATEFDRMADRVADTLRGQRDLLRGVSHELRTPLARLTLALDEALELDEGPARTAMLRRMERSLDDMRLLVDELLAIGRLEASGADEMAAVALRPLVEDAERLARELDAQLRLECDVGVETVRGDARLIRRAVNNLVTNAVRYAAGRVRITARNDGDHVELAVEDDGPGVPAADRERVFDTFARGDESRAAHLGGVGLGLAIVRQVAQAHGGSARVESSALGGARFVIRLPAGDDAG